jgi:cytidylate kinase
MNRRTMIESLKGGVAIKDLRSPNMIVTIDGPAGSGKTTVAHTLAGRLGLDSLDTGAMYRSVALLAMEADVSPHDHDAVVALARDHRIDFDWMCTPPRILLDERDVDARLRQSDVSEIVSQIAGIPALRTAMVQAQREIAARHPRLVTEGRDQGSVVFPDAEVRFYLDADSGVRATRRALEMRERGENCDVDEIRHAIEARDQSDRGRKDAPLTIPKGAIRIDTGELTVEEVVSILLGHIRECTGLGPENGS